MDEHVPYGLRIHGCAQHLAASVPVGSFVVDLWRTVAEYVEWLDNRWSPPQAPRRSHLVVSPDGRVVHWDEQLLSRRILSFDMIVDTSIRFGLCMAEHPIGISENKWTIRYNETNSGPPLTSAFWACGFVKTLDVGLSFYGVDYCGRHVTECGFQVNATQVSLPEWSEVRSMTFVVDVERGLVSVSMDSTVFMRFSGGPQRPVPTSTTSAGVQWCIPDIDQYHPCVLFSEPGARAMYSGTMDLAAAAALFLPSKK